MLLDGNSAGRSHLLANSKWNLVAFLITLAANFVTIPYVIDAIGMDEFGTAGLILAALAPMMLVGTVLGQATLREISHRFASKDLGSARRIFSSAMALCALAGAAVLLVILLFGSSFISLLNRNGQATNWQLAMTVATTGWLAQQFVLVLQSTVAATQKYKSMALISVVATVASAVTIMTAVTLKPDGLGYLAGTALGFGVALMVWTVLVCRGFPWLLPVSNIGRAEIQAILAFGKWQGAGHLIGALGIQMDRYVLGAMAPLTVVGQYNVAMRLQEVMQMPVMKIGEILFPHFSVTSTDGMARRADFFLTASWVLNTVAVCALAPLIPLAEESLKLWVHHSEATGAASILRTLATAGIIGSGVNVYSYFAMGTGQPAALAKLTAVYSVLAILLTALLIHQYGVRGAGVGAVIAGIVRLLLVIYLSKRYFGNTVSKSDLITATLFPLLAGLGIGWLWCSANLLEPHSWSTLGLSYIAIASSVALTSIAISCTNIAGRRMVLNTVHTMHSILFKRA